MNRRVQIAISLAVTIAALWYSLHGLDLGESLAALRGLRLGWLAVVVALAALSLWMRAQRWRFILGTLGPLGSTPVFEATCIGFMGNMVLPLRAGEIIRPLVAARAGAAIPSPLRAGAPHPPSTPNRAPPPLATHTHTCTHACARVRTRPR